MREQGPVADLEELVGRDARLAARLAAVAIRMPRSEPGLPGMAAVSAYGWLRMLDRGTVLNGSRGSE